MIPVQVRSFFRNSSAGGRVFRNARTIPAVAIVLLWMIPPAGQAVRVRHFFTETAGITNLPEKFTWASTDSRQGTVYDNTGQYGYGLRAFNIGALTNAATWAVSDFTAYAPPQPFSHENQLCATNAYDMSAVQASGLNWGVYMKGADWNGEGGLITIRYHYRHRSLPPLAYRGGTFIRLLVEANIAVPRYTGRKPPGAPEVPVGWCVVNVVLVDLSTKQNLTVILSAFDTRGYRLEDEEGAILWQIGPGRGREICKRLVGNQMVVTSFYAPGTVYCNQLPGSSDSRIDVWSEKTYFGYELTAEHFNKIIEKANQTLSETEPDTPHYSTDLKDWALGEASVGIEATWLEHEEGPAFSMSYIGDTFKISAEYNKEGPLFLFKTVALE